MLIINGDHPMALAVEANRDLTMPIDAARNAAPEDITQFSTPAASSPTASVMQSAIPSATVKVR